MFTRYTIAAPSSTLIKTSFIRTAAVFTEWLRLEGTSGGSSGHLDLAATTMFRLLLNISKGDSTSSLGKPCQCLVTLREKKNHPNKTKPTNHHQMRGNFLCFSFCPLRLSLGNTENSLAPSSLHSPSRDLYTVKFPWACSSPGWTVYFSQPFPVGEMLQPLNNLGSPLMNSLECLCLSCTDEPRTGPGMASPVPAIGEESPPLTC